jgi:hypothetical protein
MTTVKMAVRAAADSAADVEALAPFFDQLTTAYAKRGLDLEVTGLGDEPAPEAGPAAEGSDRSGEFRVFLLGAAADASAQDLLDAAIRSEARDGQPQAAAVWFRHRPGAAVPKGQAELRRQLALEPQVLWNTWSTLEELKFGLLLQLAHWFEAPAPFIVLGYGHLGNLQLVDMAQVPAYAEFRGLGPVVAQARATLGQALSAASGLVPDAVPAVPGDLAAGDQPASRPDPAGDQAASSPDPAGDEAGGGPDPTGGPTGGGPDPAGGQTAGGPDPARDQAAGSTDSDEAAEGSPDSAGSGMGQAMALVFKAEEDFSDATDMAMFLARDRGPASPLAGEAARAFLAGDFAKALEALDPDRLAAQTGPALAAAKTVSPQATENQTAAAPATGNAAGGGAGEGATASGTGSEPAAAAMDLWLMRSELLKAVGEGEGPAAEEAIRQAMALEGPAGTYPTASLYWANFLVDAYRGDEAAAAYREVLESGRPLDPADAEAALKAAVALLIELDCPEEAAELVTRFAEPGPGAGLEGAAEYAERAHIAAEAWLDLDQPDKAAEYASRPVEAIKPLLQDTPSADAEPMAGLVSWLDRSLDELGFQDEAASLAAQSAPFLRRAAADSPELQGQLLYTVMRAGIGHEEAENFEDAASAFQEVMALLQLTEPRELHMEADVSGRLGIALLQLDRIEEAEAALRAAAHSHGKAAKANPEYRGDLADALTSLGIFYDSMEDLRRAERSFDQAAAVYRGLVREDPEAHAGAFVDLQRRQAELYGQLHNSGKLRKVLEEMLALARDRVQEDEDFLDTLADALTGLGILAADTRQPKQAAERLSEAVSIWRRLNESSPGVYREPLRDTLEELASAYSALGRDLAARAVAGEADQL